MPCRPICWHSRRRSKSVPSGASMTRATWPGGPNWISRGNKFGWRNCRSRGSLIPVDQAEELFPAVRRLGLPHLAGGVTVDTIEELVAGQECLWVAGTRGLGDRGRRGRGRRDGRHLLRAGRRGGQLAQVDV